MLVALPSSSVMTEKRKAAPKAHPGHYIRQWRERRKETQESLAEKVGLTHGAIHQLETGATGYRQKTLEAIAVALDCTPSELLEIDPTSMSSEQLQIVREIIDVARRYDQRLVDPALEIAHMLAQRRSQQ